MNFRIALIALVCIGLAGCNQSASHVLSQLTIATVGHDTPGIEEPSEDAEIPSVASSVEVSSMPEPSSSAYVPPQTEACSPGDFQFRVWSCDETGHRAYI